MWCRKAELCDPWPCQLGGLDLQSVQSTLRGDFAASSSLRLLLTTCVLSPDDAIATVDCAGSRRSWW